MTIDTDALAAIDLGSNSFHLVVAREEQGEIRVVEKLGEKVQLAAGIGKDKCLSEEAIDRGLSCLSRFTERLKNVPQDRIRIVGTNALRVAKNSGAFIKRAREVLYAPVEVIAGREEARLIYLGVSHTLSDDAGAKLVVDIGGGSTEFIIGERFEPIEMESLHMGCVSYRTRFFADGKIKRKNFDQAVLVARMELQSIRDQYLAQGWQDAIGSSGTIRNIERVVVARGWTEGGITRESLDKLRSLILSYNHVDELDIEGLKVERKSVFPSGVAILLAVFDALGIERMEYSDGALREGVLYDVLGRLSHEDVRERTVLALMERFHVVKEHAAVCEQTAVTLFDQLQAEWSLKPQDRELLSWAACLHEVGRVIAHSQFHKHGAYLIGQSDLAGFTKGEQEELAILVRLHRRKISLLVLDNIEPSRAKELKRLVILLRLAVTLCAPRFMTQPPKVQAELVKGVVQLSFNDDWPTEYSLGLDMLREEMTLWPKIGFEGTIFLD
ncbi:exopolyphosphatase [Litoribrevibacter albus]|uniref:Exopolyphosphatase n=1 Tax=Litoribrevibacter albus TaxID=1473156 RepID=A0AA37SBT3_9GAMM|nr:exopolyphosphatase [Litoribrevibacter albus]GLQ33075.1 exopolyphosphatase [Litoribrevibacter albus]